MNNDLILIISLTAIAVIFFGFILYVCMCPKKIYDETKSYCENYGHRYEPRYSTKPGRWEGMEGSLDACREMMEASKAKTYECDVCVKCGRVITKGKV